MQAQKIGDLHDICSKGQVLELKQYLGNLNNTQILEEHAGFLGYTPLHQATSRGHADCVALLLWYGADANAPANGGYTPLHLAASMNFVDCVKELLRNDADISVQDGFGKTPFETAVIHRCKPAARILKSEEIKKLARENNPHLKEILQSITDRDITDTCLQEALCEGCKMGHVNAINSIAIAGVSRRLRFEERNCMLVTVKLHFIPALSVLLVCYAAQNNLLKLLKYLLEVPLVQEEKDAARQQMPFSQQIHPLINSIRAYYKADDFQVAVPLQLALYNEYKEVAKVLLLCFNCNKDSKEIDWRKLGLRELDSSLLKKIRWPEKLVLSSNLLAGISNSIVDLDRLCRLDLQKNKLRKIPSGLLKMTCLKYLDLSDNELTDLPRKEWSPVLKTLYLSGNLLETLPDSMASAKLVNLYLARNRLYEVPACVCELLTLEILDLSDNNRLTRLPEKMGKLTKISTLRLDNLEQVTDPPEEIKRNGVKTIMYLRAKLRSARGYYSMKLMLVGREAQGKTTLMHRLMLDNTYFINSATNGISMEEFRLKKDFLHREFIFKIWDFGGQEDYYATHQCFISTLSLYILVWNLEEGEEGAARLEGWLDTISARAPGSSLVIVGTHLDRIKSNISDYGEDYVSHMHNVVVELCELPKYNRICVKAIKEVSCGLESREGIDDLRNKIYDIASSLLKSGPNQVPVMGEPIPHSYFTVEELIAKKREELKAEKKLPFIHRAEFEALVTDTTRSDALDIEDPDDVKEITKFLHERGIVMHYDDPNQDLQDYYFIDPAWLCDLMARIVTLPIANPHFKEGILSKDKFEFIFRDETFPYEYYTQFVRLLNRFQIACSLDENRLLVPSKLPEETPKDATSADLRYITVKRFHSLPFMPYGFWDRFIARFLYYTRDMVVSGCTPVPSPGSPASMLRTPYDLDPCCCKCRLTSDEPIEEEISETSDNVATEDVNAHEDPENCTGDENRNEVTDGLDPYARYVLEEDVDGVYINGVWFSGITKNGEDSSSDEDCSDDYEDYEESSFNSKDSGTPYRIQVIRQNGYAKRFVEKRAASGRKRKPLSQSFTSGELQAGLKQNRSARLKKSTSNSLPKHLPQRKEIGSPAVSPLSASLNGYHHEAVVRSVGNVSTSLSDRGTSFESRDQARIFSHQDAPSSCPHVGFGTSNTIASGDRFHQQPGSSEDDSSLLSTSSSNGEQEIESKVPSTASESVKGVLSPTPSQDEVFLPENSREKEGLHPQQLDFEERNASSNIEENVEEASSAEGVVQENSTRRSRILDFLECPVHEPNCPCLKEHQAGSIPELPSDLPTLIDRHFLRCWRSGVCLSHQDTNLFVKVSHIGDPQDKSRELIVTEVSPNRLGRRILSYVVDHIDTLIREWYPDLSFTDGRELKVRQAIPCTVCERLGTTPTMFPFVQCQAQSSISDSIPCPNHPEVELNLHLVAPDIMLHDVDPDLLLSTEEIKYENTESNLIGSGGFGKVVVRGECRGQPVAIKFFDKCDDEIDPLRHYFEARKELNVLRRVRQHPYLINIIGVSLRPLCLVLELAEKGNLSESLSSPIPIHRIVLFRIAYQIADALAYLHTLGVIYRDLKPENILVWSLNEGDDLYVKLIDFGTANFATSAGLISMKGTSGNHAPEMLDVEKREYTEQVDIYSYAILLYQIITRKLPFTELKREPEINQAVVNGERPKWRDCPVAFYGLPSLTELMLECWVSKPTRRPKSGDITQQVKMPAFQLVLGKMHVPSEQSVRHACVVPNAKEIWIACFDHTGNTVLVFDYDHLALKHTFSVDTFQETIDAFKVQCMHLVGDQMLIAFRGSDNFINAYSTGAKYKLLWSIRFNENITCLSSDGKYLFVGMNEGVVRIVQRKDVKKHENRRSDVNIKVERHRILSLIAVGDRLWVSSSKYVYTYFTKACEMEAFDMESMWYGGIEGFEESPQTQMSNLTVSFDGLHVWTTCRCVLTKWCLETRQRIFDLDCSAVIQGISSGGLTIQERDADIVCLAPALDTVWVGTGSGHILICKSEEARLITWFRPFQEVRTLSLCTGPGPYGTEQCFVVSTGKGLRGDGLGTSNPIVCPLTPERVHEVQDEMVIRKNEEARAKTRKRSLSAPKLKSGSSVDNEDGGMGARIVYKSTMIVWEALTANVLERIEHKSGRVINHAFYEKVQNSHTSCQATDEVLR
ncbi:leucine-rich repeat serine/threonine-protein kinase 2 isoform X2 [Nematostella vectensis]|uniref:leucine-rich repeat serine/threonine-protein kinase 2 isoform X2 n=1 Tax=Nematostella vectensis TaxID=45351 RepID=UPI0020779217|nr:leucine-rich repeat serine/threonine-protein kinase 2 isoform X2 [Nematostella vectensis]XP_032226653.2 leucine-rich repeat serine/threonine-protein kinase 2 isoform X2 [Nematostella vectensis]